MVGNSGYPFALEVSYYDRSSGGSNMNLFKFSLNLTTQKSIEIWNEIVEKLKAFLVLKKCGNKFSYPGGILTESAETFPNWYWSKYKVSCVSKKIPKISGRRKKPCEVLVQKFFWKNRKPFFVKGKLVLAISRSFLNRSSPNLVQTKGNLPPHLPDYLTKLVLLNLVP